MAVRDGFFGAKIWPGDDSNSRHLPGKLRWRVFDLGGITARGDIIGYGLMPKKRVHLRQCDDGRSGSIVSSLSRWSGRISWVSSESGGSLVPVYEAEVDPVGESGILSMPEVATRK